MSEVKERHITTFNKLGFRGVYYDGRRNRFQASVRVAGSTVRTKWYKSKEEAAMEYDEILKDVTGIDFPKNIPLNGDRAIEVKRVFAIPNRCSGGHDMTIVGNVSKGGHCKICWRIATAEYKKRKKTRT